MNRSPCLFGAFLFLIFGTLVWAGEADRFALVMGNAAYEGAAALANSANDANDMAQALASIGWKVTKVVDGDRKTMNRAVAEFRETLAASTNPTALLFYAGHGVQIGGQNYLIPVKETFATSDEVVTDAISLQFILNAFEEAKVTTDIVILDACRDNPFAKTNSRGLGGTRGLTVVNRSSNVEGSVVMFSTAPGDTAADGTGRNGIFTQALLKYLTTGLKLQDMATKVTGEVKRLTGGKQVPFNSISLSDDFYMVPAYLRTGTAPETQEAAPIVTLRQAAPAAPDTNAVRASLVVEKQTLVQQKQTLQAQASWSGWVGWSGFVGALAGSGLAGYAYWAGAQALTSYKSAVTANDFSSSRDQVNSANLLFKIGLGVGAGGLVVGLVSLFLAPDTSTVDRQIQAVEKKITLLGAS